MADTLASLSEMGNPFRSSDDNKHSPGLPVKRSKKLTPRLHRLRRDGGIDAGRVEDLRFAIMPPVNGGSRDSDLSAGS